MEKNPEFFVLCGLEDTLLIFRRQLFHPHPPNPPSTAPVCMWTVSSVYIDVNLRNGGSVHQTICSITLGTLFYTALKRNDVT